MSASLPDPTSDAENNSLRERDLITADGTGDVIETARDLERVLDALPPEQRENFLAVVKQTVIQHSGWLPPPDMLARYNEILPGLAERIVAMPEREQGHRHQAIERQQRQDYTLKRWGQNLAMGALVLILLFCLFLAYSEEFAWAGRVAIGTVIGVVGIFVTGKWADAKSEQAESADEA